MAKALPKTGFYDVADISLDNDNYRHPTVKNERQALQELLSKDKKHKVLELAKDIVEHGLDPTSRLIITPDKKNKGAFIVLEGNRRITALKTLLNPQIASGLPSATEFKKLSKDFLRAPITKVECVELPPKDAKLWVRRKHYKGMGGAGTISWDAIATARSDADEGKYARWLAAINFLEGQGHDVDYLHEGLEDKSTTIDRVFRSSHMKTLLGVNIAANGNVSFDKLNDKQGSELLIKLFDKMVEDGFKETHVSNASQQETFLKQFLPPSKGGDGKDGDGKDGDGKGDGGGDKGREGDKKKKGKEARKKDRDKLAEKGLDISHEHLNKFYEELVKLPVQTYKHCSAAMIRIFLEKATMVFLEEMKIPHPDKTGKLKWAHFEVKLRDKVAAALKEIDPKKTNTNLKWARDIANGHTDKVHSLDLLNEYIHDHKSLPAPTELLTAWNRLHPYYEALFNAIEQKNA